MAGYIKRAGLFSIGLVLLSQAVTVLAEEEVLVIEGAEIRGDQEQPKILYIVPWQRPDSRGGLEGSSVELAGAGLLKPIYREEFIREVQYYDLFHPQAKAMATEATEQ